MRRCALHWQLVDQTDENGNHSQRTNDALGRLTEVMEPNPSTGSLQLETDYSYDALNNLNGVTQWGGSNGSSGSRSRSFTYDSLSRLLQSQNSESGTVSYSYVSAGASLCAGDASPFLGR